MRRERRFDLAADAGLAVFARWLEREAMRLEERAARARNGVGERLARRAVVLRGAAAMLKGVG